MTILLSSFLFEVATLDTSKRCIVTAGAPGSGKTTVIQQIVANLDFRNVDADNILSYLMKRDNMSTNMSKLSWDQKQQIDKYRDDLRRQTMKARDLSAKHGKGIIIHTTGANYEWLIGQVNTLINDFGYDVKMLYVDATLEQALERNRGRERRIPDRVVARSYEAVEKNKDKYRAFFGSNFHYISNSFNKAEVRRIERELQEWKPAREV